jgi:hypothetical protein
MRFFRKPAFINRRAAALAAAVFLVLSVICFSLPPVRKKTALTKLGEKTAGELTAFSVALSHYASHDIEVFADNPAVNPFFKELSGLLAKVRSKNRYVALSVVVADKGGKYRYFADADYRDNAVAGIDYRAPGSFYPFEEYKGSKTLLDSVAGQKAIFAYSSGLILRHDLRSVSVTYLPLLGVKNNVLAIIAADCDPGDTRWHMLGALNLNILGGIFAVFFAVFSFVFILTKRQNQEEEPGGEIAKLPAAQDNE